ncbi:MAG: N-6 DNA methylase [Planctomycetaceae bacterium]|jgi:methylase of polypeptide subunit release factors|nr:N-6 DNA methylase [Planctomycetaceae bacterium]
MKIYAFETPDISKNAGYLKIGETRGSVEKRVEQEGHELNIEHKIVWQDSIITDRSHIDKRIHRFLAEQGFSIQIFSKSGKETELVKCKVSDLERAFEIIKQQIYNEEKQREEVGNQFYLEIRNWFYWAAKTGDCLFSAAKPEYTLRLIIRLILCFFLQEKNLIPKELFDEHWLNENLKEDGYKFYNVILRNLFFHCLNTQVKGRDHFEYQTLIRNINIVKEKFRRIPFLNGGLFTEIEGDDHALEQYYFFGEKQKANLKELGGGEYEVEGIIRILSKYKYKLSLDDLIDHTEYSQIIDPEFLGKVFESLLSCVEADTEVSRRKVTGSFYTPREIVEYMVNESLDEYLKTNNDLLKCKILDPACGSGAFPCGIMNTIMNRLYGDSRLSKTEKYYKKLEILQNVIYGADIQPIAVQITVLRLFLSLIQDIQPDKKSDNYGIEPLPNLETKFICADTLLGLKKEKQQRFELPLIKSTAKMLQETRKRHFMVHDILEKQQLQEYDKSLCKDLSSAMEDAGDLSHETAELLLQWSPYDQTVTALFFDPVWMFGLETNFDIIIGNPPYVESRSANVPKDLKKKYQEQVKREFGDSAQYIKQGSDLLIYFFPRSITLLSENGMGILIVQNGWLNTDYGAEASQFLTKTLQYIKITESSFRHFDKTSANINTVIVEFKKQSQIKKVCFDIMEKDNSHIIKTNKKSFKIDDTILSEMKWGTIMSTDKDMLSIFQTVIEKGKTIDQSFYTVGQGINVKQNIFIPKKNCTKFEQKKNIINAVFKEYQYIYTDFEYFIYHSFTENKRDIETLNEIKAEEFNTGKAFTRKYPAVIMPRGIGNKHFAGLLTKQALSNSFVDIYLNEPDEEKQLNIWLFCNSGLFFLYREISGRKNLGGGLLKSEAADIKLLPLYFPIASSKEIKMLFDEMGTPINLQDRLKTSVQQKIDKLVFDYFDFSAELRLKIISELLRLFEFRCKKATQ